MNRAELQAQGKHAEARSRMEADIYDLASKLKTDLVQVVNLPPQEGSIPTILSEREWTYDGRKIIRVVDGNLLTIEVEPETGRRIGMEGRLRQPGGARSVHRQPGHSPSRPRGPSHRAGEGHGVERSPVEGYPTLSVIHGVAGP